MITVFNTATGLHIHISRVAHNAQIGHWKGEIYFEIDHHR